MNINEYQDWTIQTAIYPVGTGSNLELSYLALGLTSEAGEVAGKVKRFLEMVHTILVLLCQNLVMFYGI